MFQQSGGRSVKLNTLLIIALFFLPLFAYAQDTTKGSPEERIEEIKGAMEGMNETLLEMKSVLDALRKLKFSGYLQAQYQVAEGPGISSFSAGDFPRNVRSRVQIRRGRFKFDYDNDLTHYVMEIDVTQNGFALRDAYLSVKEPWLRTLSLTAGAFYRPFGFEISYSSGNRESPEQSRLFQTLFPNERELGAQLEIAQEEGPLSSFNLKAGIFNGVLTSANENDDTKDFIGRAGIQLPFEEQSLVIDAGVSLYAGKVTNNSKYVFSIDKTTRNYAVDSTSSNVSGTHARTYYGLDAELYYDLPVLGGLSLRGEYITGKQPGTAGSNGFYNPGATIAPVYVRKFHGWYVNYVQNIGLDIQFIVKYDTFDPNTDVNAQDIGSAGSTHSAADIKFNTLGIGWIYHWDTNVKFLVYCDIVMNEKINPAAAGALAAYSEDIRDNVLTLRVQYKF